MVKRLVFGKISFKLTEAIGREQATEVKDRRFMLKCH